MKRVLFSEGDLMFFGPGGFPLSSGRKIVSDPAIAPSTSTIWDTQAVTAKIQSEVSAVQSAVAAVTQLVPPKGSFIANTFTFFDADGKLQSTPFKVDNVSAPNPDTIYTSSKVLSLIQEQIAAAAASETASTTHLLKTSISKIGNFMKTSGSSQKIFGGTMVPIEFPTVDSHFGDQISFLNGGLLLKGAGIYSISCTLILKDISSVNFDNEFTIDVSGDFVGNPNRTTFISSETNMQTNHCYQAELYLETTSDCHVVLKRTGGSTDPSSTASVDPSSFLAAHCIGMKNETAVPVVPLPTLTVNAKNSTTMTTRQLHRSPLRSSPMTFSPKVYQRQSFFPRRM